jgi:hypothetical protein
MTIALPEKTRVRAGGSNPYTVNIAHRHGTILTATDEFVDYSSFSGLTPGVTGTDQ